jgi:hypothetical protein
MTPDDYHESALAASTDDAWRYDIGFAVFIAEACHDEIEAQYERDRSDDEAKEAIAWARWVVQHYEWRQHFSHLWPTIYGPPEARPGDLPLPEGHLERRRKEWLAREIERTLDYRAALVELEIAKRGGANVKFQ